jgi:hypothetical protein
MVHVLHKPLPVMAFPDAGSVFGLFFCCFFFSFHSLPLLCLNVTGLFVGLDARFIIFYLLIVLECKE